MNKVNSNTLHVVGFSGGVPSAVVAEIVATQYPDSTILLFHDTHTEPIDNVMFRWQIAEMLNLDITERSDGRDIWQVFEDEGILGNGRNTPCSRILKQEPSMKYMLENQPAILYIGYTVDEWRRAQRLSARYAHKGIETRFPLIDKRIGKEECMHRVKECWNIEPPSNYEWAEHANCIPCVKGKKAYWGLIHIYEREAWERAVQAENYFGHTIFTEAGSLTEELDNCLRLARAYLNKKTDERRQVDMFEFPCECMT